MGIAKQLTRPPRPSLAASLLVLWQVSQICPANAAAPGNAWPLRRPYDLLFGGKYEQAFVAAGEAIAAHEADLALVGRAIHIQSEAMAMLNDEKRALSHLDSVIERYKDDDRIHSRGFPVPVSLFMKRQVAMAKTRLFRCRQDYERAIRSFQEQLRVDNDFIRLFGPLRAKNHRLFVDTDLRVRLGDLYRHNGQYSHAAAEYEAALQRLRSTARPRDPEAVSETAIPNSHYYLGRLPWLIERCRDQTPLTIEAKYARAVDFPFEMAKWHWGCGEGCRNHRQCVTALKIYQECRRFLVETGVSEQLPDRERQRYAELRDMKLPKRIAEVQLLIKAISETAN